MPHGCLKSYSQGFHSGSDGQSLNVRQKPLVSMTVSSHPSGALTNKLQVRAHMLVGMCLSTRSQRAYHGGEVMSTTSCGEYNPLGTIIYVRRLIKVEICQTFEHDGAPEV